MNPLIIQNRIIIELIINVGMWNFFNKNHINNVIMKKIILQKLLNLCPNYKKFLEVFKFINSIIS